MLIAQLTDGSLLNGHNATCNMVVTFENPEFLPLTLHAVPRNCSGNQIATLVVPEGVPNGLMSMQWCVPCRKEYPSAPC